ncbi:MAG TPA: hypothetical protein VI756_16080 [Blastocatellia bacterium]
MDRRFIAIYKARQAAVLEHQPAYIVATGNSLVLYAGGKKATARMIPDRYEALKDVAHVPFALYLMLSAVDKGTATLDSQMDALRRFGAQIEAARPELTERRFSSGQTARQKEILDATYELVERTLRTRSLAHGELASFARTMAPLQLQNIAEAGCAQIETTHAQMMTWKAQLSAEDWAHLIAVNETAHQARYRSLLTQYFHWLFGDTQAPAWAYPGETMRVIVLETSFGSADPAGDILTGAIIDADAADAFFGNPWRLSEDALSDAAAACIEKLPQGDRDKQRGAPGSR